MRIKKLKLKNINSFKGEFEIDFEKFSGKLFLISGPTGSGKTTIIDSILASLYHKTPRLSNQVNMLLNKNSTDGYIKLLFTHKNKECEIELKFDKRGTKKFLKGGERYLDKVKEITEYINEFIGLDYEQFTRSIVLAQGEFDKFIKSTPKEKSEILKKIFNLESFAKVSIAIYEKYNRKKDMLNNLYDLIEKIDIKSLYEEKEDILDKLSEFKILKIEIEEEKTKKEKDLSQKKELNEKIKKLKKLEDEYKQEKSLKNKNQKEINILEKEIKNLKSNIKKRENELNNLEEKYKVYERIEIELNNLKDEESKLKKEFRDFQKRYEDEVLQKDLLSNKLESIKNKKFNFDESLIEKKEDYQNRYVILKKAFSQEEKKEKELETKKNELAEIKNNLEKLKKEIEELTLKKEKLEEKVLIFKFEKHRSYLKKNTPCPLCGSKNHNFDNLDSVSEDDINEYENLVKILKEKEEEFKDKEIKQNILESEISKLEGEISSLEEEIKQNYFDEYKSWREIFNQINEYLKNKNEIEKLSSLIEEKQKTLKLYKENIDNKKNKIDEVDKKIENLQKDKKELYDGNLKEDIEKISKELESLKENLEKNEKSLKIKEINIAKIEERLNTLNKEIKSLSEVKDKKEEDLSLLEKEIKNLEIKLDEIKKDEGIFEERIKHIKQKIDEYKKLKKEYEELNRQVNLLKILNDEIGSANGSKFVNKALGFLIDNLIFEANKILNRLSNNRYSLSIKEKLEFEIIDHFIGDTKRDINTLSGGESFLVSLSLSLALSEISKSSVSLDTMFLDEGFGTLDKDSLSEVLSLLQSLAIGEKMIGIISHVELLQSEMPDKIIIQKRGNGESVIVKS
ncbi:SMC family ATPase [Caminibacter mediatlanticus TB-2]|uniref:SMC family ATPase n=1 Tax=Caminibacter mediatlanticus TB-2 TaxID=391592 RepID=A0ABX5V8D7_9BACT|nr:SMC family ATPase [Caminibacter mediatlanticus]QCT93642.1 SMC family ATPase [Caminibacter mediatlanticus TB-2]